MNAFDFGTALSYMREGKPVTRQGYEFPVNYFIEFGEIVCDENGRRCEVALLSEDLLALDWILVEKEKENDD